MLVVAAFFGVTIFAGWRMLLKRVAHRFVCLNAEESRGLAGDGMHLALAARMAAPSVIATLTGFSLACFGVRYFDLPDTAFVVFAIACVVIHSCWAYWNVSRLYDGHAYTSNPQQCLGLSKMMASENFIEIGTYVLTAAFLATRFLHVQFPPRAM